VSMEGVNRTRARQSYVGSGQHLQSTSDIRKTFTVIAPTGTESYGTTSLTGFLSDCHALGKRRRDGLGRPRSRWGQTILDLKLITGHGRATPPLWGQSGKGIDREAQRLRRCLPYTAEGALPPVASSRSSPTGTLASALLSPRPMMISIETMQPA
jgi:hypothetical protein